MPRHLSFSTLLSNPYLLVVHLHRNEVLIVLSKLYIVNRNRKLWSRLHPVNSKWTIIEVIRKEELFRTRRQKPISIPIVSQIVGSNLMRVDVSYNVVRRYNSTKRSYSCFVSCTHGRLNEISSFYIFSSTFKIFFCEIYN